MRNRIKQRLIGERELDLRIPARDVLTVRPGRLREAVIHINSAAAGLPIEYAIDRHLMMPVAVLGVSPRALDMLGLVEPKQHEIMHRSTWLRGAEGVDELDIPCQRVRRTLVIRLRVAEEGCQIADNSKAETRQFRVHGRIGELVEPGRPKDA